MLSLASGLCALALVVVSALSVIATPFSDPHDWDALVFATERSGRWLAYLWTPHTAQRIVFVRILTWLDMDVTHGRVPVFLIATLMPMLAGVAVLSTVLLRRIPDRKLAVLLAAGASMLLANMAAAEDCAFPVFSVYVLVAGFAVAAIALFEFAPEGGGRRLFLAALLCAVCAGFGNAAGLAIWPVLVVCGVRERHPNWRQAVTFVVGCLYVALTCTGLGVPSSHFGATPLLAPAHLIKMLIYFCAYCGLPAAAGYSSATWIGRALGLGLAALGAWRLLQGDRTAGPLRDVERIGRGLVLFGLLTAVLATLGRVDENPQAIVPTRYFPFAGMLQAGLLLACASDVERLWRARPRLARGGLFAALLLFLALEVAVAKGHLSIAAHVKAASVAFDSGDRSPKVMRFIHPVASTAVAVRAELARRGLPH